MTDLTGENDRSSASCMAPLERPPDRPPSVAHRDAKDVVHCVLGSCSVRARTLAGIHRCERSRHGTNSALLGLPCALSHWFLDTAAHYRTPTQRIDHRLSGAICLLSWVALRFSGLAETGRFAGRWQSAVGGICVTAGTWSTKIGQKKVGSGGTCRC